MRKVSVFKRSGFHHLFQELPFNKYIFNFPTKSTYTIECLYCFSKQYKYPVVYVLLGGKLKI
jgi:hypothetical protein